MAKRDRNYLLLARKLRERAEEALTIANTYRDTETRGHYSRPELLNLAIDRTPVATVHERQPQARS